MSDFHVSSRDLMDFLVTIPFLEHHIIKNSLYSYLIEALNEILGISNPKFNELEYTE